MNAEVLTCVESGVGRIRLNRPRAIHALTHGMCDAIVAALLTWRHDPAISAVLLDHAEGRGFCAGGDIRMLAESAAADGVAARAFYYREYQLNHLMFTYPKPIVAVMDGITMGGGVGISQPARYRVVTERTVYAMPETGIGLFPDVGGSWYLPRMQGHSGRYLAVTGARIDGADCMSLGIATHYVPSARLDELKAAIVANADALAATLDGFAEPPPAARIDDVRAVIDRVFAGATLEGILAALDAEGSEWAGAQRAAMNTKSPQTMKVALEQMKRGAGMADFADVMRMEYGLACRIIERPDFVEGVRAVIVDKDNAPKWNPARPELVSDSLIAAIFAPLPPDEAWQPLSESP